MMVIQQIEISLKLAKYIFLQWDSLFFSNVNTKSTVVHVLCFQCKKFGVAFVFRFSGTIIACNACVKLNDLI
jgi:hypothetical protein